METYFFFFFFGWTLCQKKVSYRFRKDGLKSEILILGKTCKEGLFFFSCKKQHSYEVTLKGNRNDQVIYQKRKDMHAV